VVLLGAMLAWGLAELVARRVWRERPASDSL
jgi:hypothetical protein